MATKKKTQKKTPLPPHGFKQLPTEQEEYAAIQVAFKEFQEYRKKIEDRLALARAIAEKTNVGEPLALSAINAVQLKDSLHELKCAVEHTANQIEMLAEVVDESLDEKG